MKLDSIIPYYKKIVLISMVCMISTLLTTLLFPDFFKTHILLLIYTLVVLLVIVLVAIKLLLQLQLNEKRVFDNYIQLEAFQQINAYINPPLPLPPTGDWAATADYIKEIFISILTNKPKVIVEIGSGVSSLYIGQLIKEHQLDCVLYSLENDSIFAEISKNNNKLYNVEKQVKLTLSEITNYEINNKKWLWYDSSFLESINSIDMLLVDGPSMLLQKHARYPAIPLVFDHLSNNATILVDDYNRKDEQEMVKMWTKEYPSLSVVKTTASVKGFCLLKNQ